MQKRFYSFLFFSLLFLPLLSIGQETQDRLDSELTYKKALSLFDQGNYLSARKKFEAYLNEHRKESLPLNYLIESNAQFYIAVAAYELSDYDAEKLLLDFIGKYHESDRRRRAYFYLGKYYYDTKNTSKAIKWFAKASLEDLSNDEIVDYKFQLAYSHFVRKNFDEALPLFKEIKGIENKYYYPSNYYYGIIAYYQGNYNVALESFQFVKESEIYRPIVPYYIAQVYFIKKQFQKVIDYSSPFIGDNSVKNKIEIYKLLGQSHFELGDYEKAIEYLDVFNRASKKISQYDAYQLAYAKYKTGKFEEAVDDFQKLNSLKDSLGQNALYALADCYIKLDEKDKARSAFQEAAKMDYDPMIKQASAFNYAKLSAELNYYREAIVKLESFIKEYPDSPFEQEAYEVLSETLINTKDYNKALEIIESMSKKTARINQAYQKIAYIKAAQYFRNNDLTNTLLYLRKSLDLPLDKSINALSLLLEGDVFYKRKAYNKSRSSYLKFIELLKTYQLTNLGADKSLANYNIGYTYFKEQQYSNAIAFFEKSIAGEQIDEKNRGRISDAYIRAADCSFVLNEYSVALKNYSLVLDQGLIGRDYASLQKAVILGLINKQDEKLALLESALKSYPNSIYKDDITYELGSSLIELQRSNEAISTFNSLVKDFPKSKYRSKAYLRLGLLYFNQGNNVSAISNYKEVVEQYPKTLESREALKTMREIYITLGDPEGYIKYVEKNGDLSITASEQDSIIYKSAEELYFAGEYARSKVGFASYLARFGNGYFNLEANFYKGESHFKLKEYKAAYPHYVEVADAALNRFSELACLKAAEIASIELKDPQKARKYYDKLLPIAQNEETKAKALLGLMKANTKLDNTSGVITYSKMVLQLQQIDDEDRLIANYNLATAYYYSGEIGKARPYLKLVSNEDFNEKGAECQYLIALELNKNRNYQESLDTCFYLKDTYSSELWVVKTFILMADNYYGLDNLFQAKATLRSIIDNYSGDPTLIKEAKEKLESIEREEMNRSNLEIITPGSDTIIELKEGNE